MPINVFAQIIAMWMLATTQARRPVPDSARGIWEELSYGKRLALNDVFFATPSEGWVAGSGTILHTADAGSHWDTQLQDSESSFRPPAALREFRFIDATHGWIVRSSSLGGELMRTTDGRAWQRITTESFDVVDYGFVSATTGIALSGTTILRTTDGGASWSVTMRCVTASAGSSPRPTSCTPRRLHIVSPDTVYVAAAANTAGATTAGWLLLKTTDAGRTWSQAAVNGGGIPDALFFTSSDTGYVQLTDGYIRGTHNAGADWLQLAPSHGTRLRFADPAVGWALGGELLTYTIDGGATWDTIPSGLKGKVVAFTLPRRDRAYAVTDGGSLYRYSVVSADSARHVAFITRAMPALDTAAAAELSKLAKQLTQPSVLAATPSAPSDTTCCQHERSSGPITVDTVLARYRVIALKHRNLNLLLDGVDNVRSVMDRAREVSLRAAQLRSASGVLARLNAFAQLTLAVDSLSALTSAAVQRMPRLNFSVRAHRRQETVAASAPEAIDSSHAAPVTPKISKKQSRSKTPASEAAKSVAKGVTVPRAPAAARSPNDSGAKKRDVDSALVRSDTGAARSTKTAPPAKKPG